MLQLSTVGTGGGVSWSLLSGGGSLQSNGLYDAGTTLQSGGPAIVSASSTTTTEQTSVGVTGAFPGLVNRIYDYVDQHTLQLPGTYTTSFAAVGNRLFASATNYLGASTNSYCWIDVYDITDPLHPAWVTAVEAKPGPVIQVGSYLYSYSDSDFAVPGYPSTITLYSLESGLPALQARTTIPPWWNISQDQGVFFEVPLNWQEGQVIEYDLTQGTIATQNLTLPLPPDTGGYLPDAAYPFGNRLFVSIDKNDLSGSYILTYDLSTSPPTLLGSIDGRSLAFYASGNLLFGALGGMEIYDISSQLPVPEGYVGGINARELVGTRLLALTEQQGCQVVDVSIPSSPT